MPPLSLKTVKGGTFLAATSPSDGYTQGDGEFATVPKNVKVEKTDEVSVPAGSTDKVTGVLNRSGNPVRIIWYGRKGDQDGETPQKGAINDGQIFGSVRATGVDNVGGKDNHNASVQVEGKATPLMRWAGRHIEINVALLTP